MSNFKTERKNNPVKAHRADERSSNCFSEDLKFTEFIEAGSDRSDAKNIQLVTLKGFLSLYYFSERNLWVTERDNNLQLFSLDPCVPTASAPFSAAHKVSLASFPADRCPQVVTDHRSLITEAIRPDPVPLPSVTSLSLCAVCCGRFHWPSPWETHRPSARRASSGSTTRQVELLKRAPSSSIKAYFPPVV